MRRLLAGLTALVLLGSCASDPADPRAPSSSRTSTTPTSSTPVETPPSSSSDPPPPAFAPHPSQLTPEGMWWAVDSTTVMSDASLANVRDWYRGGHDPAAWGRYINSAHTLVQGELAFAAKHHFAVYLIVPDKNCSICAGGSDICGNDSTAEQARSDARAAIRVAIKLRIPAHAALFKDIEEIGTCHGELTGDYLDAWYRYTRSSRYRPAFYGNSFTQRYDFVRAYCEAAGDDPAFRRDVIIAGNEPEPAIGAPRGAIGAANAPPFGPFAPHCASPDVTKIWQYGESLTSANVTDVDQIRPDTPGLILPDGSVSG